MTAYRTPESSPGQIRQGFTIEGPPTPQIVAQDATKDEWTAEMQLAVEYREAIVKAEAEARVEVEKTRGRTKWFMDRLLREAVMYEKLIRFQHRDQGSAWWNTNIECQRLVCAAFETWLVAVLEEEEMAKERHEDMKRWEQNEAPTGLSGLMLQPAIHKL
ncbi:hypothetical protein GQ53DRAFT_842495, partial [Thozetella sp. PMI_491]